MAGAATSFPEARSSARQAPAQTSFAPELGTGTGMHLSRAGATFSPEGPTQDVAVRMGMHLSQLEQKLAEAVAARDAASAAAATAEAALADAAARAAAREVALQQEVVSAEQAAARAEKVAANARQGADSKSITVIAVLEALRQQVLLAEEEAERQAADLIDALEEATSLRAQLDALSVDAAADASAASGAPEEAARMCTDADAAVGAPRLRSSHDDAIASLERRLQAKAIALVDAHDEILQLRAQLAALEMQARPGFQHGEGARAGRGGDGGEACGSRLGEASHAFAGTGSGGGEPKGAARWLAAGGVEDSIGSSPAAISLAGSPHASADSLGARTGGGGDGRGRELGADMHASAAGISVDSAHAGGAHPGGSSFWVDMLGGMGAGASMAADAPAGRGRGGGSGRGAWAGEGDRGGGGELDLSLIGRGPAARVKARPANSHHTGHAEASGGRAGRFAAAGGGGSAALFAGSLEAEEGQRGGGGANGWSAHVQTAVHSVAAAPVPQELIDLALQVIRAERTVRERAAEMTGRRLEATQKLSSVRQRLAALPPPSERSDSVPQGAHARKTHAQLRSMEERYARQMEAWEAKRKAIMSERMRSLEAALNAMSIIVSYGKPGDDTEMLLSRLRPRDPPNGCAASGMSRASCPGEVSRAAAEPSMVASANGRTGARTGGTVALGERSWGVPLIIAAPGSRVGAGAHARARASGAPALSIDALGIWKAPTDDSTQATSWRQTLPPISSPGRVAERRLSVPEPSRMGDRSSRFAARALNPSTCRMEAQS